MTPMFIGHYSAAFAAQLVDIAWALFVLSGIERTAIDASQGARPGCLLNI